jgi:hypothetical protein
MKPACTFQAVQRTRAPLTLLPYVLPLLVLLIPTRWIERHPVPCLFTAVLGVRCPGCGMTRAVSCAMHGRFKDAMRYNPLVVLVLPLAAFEWLQFMREAINDFTAAN